MLTISLTSDGKINLVCCCSSISFGHTMIYNCTTASLRKHSAVASLSHRCLWLHTTFRWKEAFDKKANERISQNVVYSFTCYVPDVIKPGQPQCVLFTLVFLYELNKWEAMLISVAGRWILLWTQLFAAHVLSADQLPVVASDSPYRYERAINLLI